MSTTTVFKEQFVKHLETLVKEVKSYEKEETVWAVRPQISNPAGTLVLHLVGNLNHFIGAQLGHTGYVRQREKEFSDRNVPVKTLLDALERTSEMVKKTFDGLSPVDLDKVFPLDTFGADKTTHEVLLIVLAHLNYHLGQVNYHRRLI